MIDLDPLAARGALQAGQLGAFFRSVRIAFRRQHDRQRGLRGERREAVPECAFGAGEKQRQQVAVEPRQQDLRLRIAESHIELDCRRAVGTDHQPDEQDPAKRRPPRAHAAQDRVHDLSHYTGGHGLVDDRRRRIGAHAAGIGTAIAIEGSLVVLGGAEKDRPLAVAQREERSFFADQNVFQHGLAVLAVDAGENGVESGARLFKRLRDYDPFAGGEPVGLDHDGSALLGEPGLGLRARAAARVGGGRDAELPAEIFGEAFRAFEPGRRAGRTKDAQALGREIVRQAGGEWSLGSHDDQSNVHEAAEGRHGLMIGQVERHIGGDRSAAGITRSNEQSIQKRAFGERDRDGVFASARAEYKNVHERAASDPQPSLGTEEKRRNRRLASDAPIGHTCSMNDAIPSNAAEFSVTELSNALKKTLEDRFGYVRVRGEISGFRGPHASGHAYFCLKDQNARLDAVIWKQTYARMRVRPQEGLEVVAAGKLTTFAGKSAYQLIIDTIEPAGLGALMALLEERRRALAAEGLFDVARKRLLPFLPAAIGVVTSPTGAVIHDILHRLADRFPRPVIVWPVRVQGENCAAEIAAAIRGLNALPQGGPIPRPSLIIVARGGGSLEDLWGFNEEIVVRAAAESALPLISAIGHETDWTLLDHVADLRAPTPTGAAELCVPVRLDLIAQSNDLGRRQALAVRRLALARRADMRSVARALPSQEAILAAPRQRADRCGERLTSMMGRALRDRQLRLGRAGALLARHAPQAELARRRERYRAAAQRLDRARAHMAPRQFAQARDRLVALRERLHRAWENESAQRSRRIRHAAQMLTSLSYASVLARGFALVRDSDDRPLRAAAQVGANMRLVLEFADGRVGALSDPTGSGTTGRPRRAGAARQSAGQGALF